MCRFFIRICENKLENCRKCFLLLFNIIHYYSKLKLLFIRVLNQHSRGDAAGHGRLDLRPRPGGEGLRGDREPEARLRRHRRADPDLSAAGRAAGAGAAPLMSIAGNAPVPLTLQIGDILETFLNTQMR